MGKRAVVWEEKEKRRRREEGGEVIMKFQWRGGLPYISWRGKKRWMEEEQEIGKGRRGAG